MPSSNEPQRKNKQPLAITSHAFDRGTKSMRRRIVAGIRNDQVHAFWKKEFPHYNPRYLAEAVVINRPALKDEVIRGQRRAGGGGDLGGHLVVALQLVLAAPAVEAEAGGAVV